MYPVTSFPIPNANGNVFVKVLDHYTMQETTRCSAFKCSYWLYVAWYVDILVCGIKLEARPVDLYLLWSQSLSLILKCELRSTGNSHRWNTNISRSRSESNYSCRPSDYLREISSVSTYEINIDTNSINSGFFNQSTNQNGVPERNPVLTINLISINAPFVNLAFIHGDD